MGVYCHEALNFLKETMKTRIILSLLSKAKRKVACILAVVYFSLLMAINSFGQTSSNGYTFEYEGTNNPYNGTIYWIEQGRWVENDYALIINNLLQGNGGPWTPG